MKTETHNFFTIQFQCNDTSINRRKFNRPGQNTRNPGNTQQQSTTRTAAEN